MVNFMQVVKWLREGKKVRRDGKGFAFDTDYITMGTEHPKHCRSEEEGFDWTLDDFQATDWKIYEDKNEYEGMSIEELIHQAHMKGQMDYGCEGPRYSNAQADCKEIIKAAKKCVLSEDSVQ